MVLEAHPDFFSGYYSRSQLKRELNDLAGAEQDYLLARAEEAKAHRVATVDPEPYTSHRSLKRLNRQTTSKLITNAMRARIPASRPIKTSKSSTCWWSPKRRPPPKASTSARAGAGYRT